LTETGFYKRAETRTENNVRVTAAVLNAQEAEELFGRPLYKKGIQPVWLEIENQSGYRMWFAPVSVDRNYFAPLEVAYLFHSSFSTATNDRMDRYFHRHSFSNPINPGQVRSGFVFSNLEMGTKAFNVDVIGEDHQVRTFTFLIPVEGIRVDHREVACHALYAAGDRIMLDSLADLKNALEALPCCTTGEDGMRPADPVNVVIVGDGSDVLYALLRSGWDETAAAASYDPLAQLPWELRYQPVKPLYFLKRPRDAAFRKSRTTLNERNQPRHRRALYRADDRNP
jgi:hypothetical protein